MLAGHELNAHSLDLINQPEGFKHQYIINIDKAREILSELASSNGFHLSEEVLRPLISKGILKRLAYSVLRKTTTARAWSMGSVMIFEAGN